MLFRCITAIALDDVATDLAINRQKMTLQSKEEEDAKRTLLGCIQDSYQSSLKKLSLVADGIARADSSSLGVMRDSWQQERRTG